MQTMGDIVRIQARERPDSTAIVFEDNTISYGELNQRTNQVANGFIALELPTAARVAYLARNLPHYYEICLAAAKTGNVSVGINTRLAGPEIAYIINDADAPVLFVGEEFYELVEALTPDLPQVSQIIALDGGHGSWPSYADWRNQQATDDPQLDIQPDDDFTQLYTSGTTGHPKGVQLTHGAWLKFAAAMMDSGWADWAPGETVLLCAPVFHVAGSNSGLIGLRQGSRIVMTAQILPQELLSFITKYKVNHTFLVPAIILALVQQPNVRDFDFSSLNDISYGASPIAESLLLEAKEIFGCDFVQLYGLTENYGGATFLPPEDHAPERNKLRSCGRPFDNSAIRIIDDNQQVVEQGEVGEICLSSEWLMKGYWKRPEATAEAIVDGWFHTGDAGYFDADGYLYIHDRIKDMIVSGGENVYPAEVENAVFGHAAVADVAVIGVPDEKWGESVKAVVVLKPDTDASAEEIIAYTRTKIAGYKSPKTIDFVTELPRNPSGKVLRRELREQYWKGHDRRVG